MKCSWVPISEEELAVMSSDEVVAQNSAALKVMMSSAGQDSVAAGHNSIPGQALKEGLPLRGRDELMPLPYLPSYDPTVLQRLAASG